MHITGDNQMKFKWLAVSLFAFSVGIQANQFPIQIIEQFDDATIVAFIDEKDLNDSNAWNPMDTEPSLSISDAVNAMKKHFHDINIKQDSYSITEIELRQIPGHAHHWHYLFKVNDSQKNKDAFFVVLMNGKTIPAINEPKSYK